ncbi:MAG: hypothetical protein OSB21_12370 [Myxococcota bacterium]|nr:hypothetical protein [Myxococcota bacterium]
MIAFLNRRLGIKKTRRILYSSLALLIASVVAPTLGGLLQDRLLKPHPQVLCGVEVKAVDSLRRALLNQSQTELENDFTANWLALRERSVALRRQCKAEAEHGPAAIAVDERVRISVATYRVQRNL